MHQEALTKEAKVLLPYFKELSDFYLAGGTALALQIGHRISVDFDFFSDKKLSTGFLKQVESVFKNNLTNILVNNSEELTLVAKNTKITFLYYPFPTLYPLVESENFRLANVQELSAMKAYTIGRRGSFKDYVDLYFVLKEKLSSIENIILDADKKYKKAFNSRMFLEQLIYTKDIEENDVIFLNEKINLAEIEKYFQEEVKKVKI